MSRVGDLTLWAAMIGAVVYGLTRVVHVDVWREALAGLSWVDIVATGFGFLMYAWIAVVGLVAAMLIVRHHVHGLVRRAIACYQALAKR